ncbi:MAG: thioredoxin domain-containing protein [Chloroflexota bacterium]|nr:thioredoxin domain-containing protein [Chloroflexota bacterium]
MAKKKKKRSSSGQSTAQPTTPTKTSYRDRKRKQNQTWLWVAAAVAVVAVGAILFFTNQSQASVSEPPAATGLSADLVDRSTMGSAVAPVVVTEYSDFGCPACKTFAETSGKQLKEEYVNPGVVRFEYKHYPLPQHEPGASWAANAAECAADQGLFWEMHDFLYQEQGKQGPNTFTQGRLRNMADALGLDSTAFDRCLSRQDHGDVIRDDINEARNLFVNSTPTVFVNGKKVASPVYSEIKAAVDAELEAQGDG